jgi:ATP-dependent protease ClpP protease subunit
MSVKKLPRANAFQRPQRYEWDAPSPAMARWAEHPVAAEADDPNTISIYDVIGEDFFGGGFTVNRAAAALRKIGPVPVTVNINSPGGDMFEGLAIYNVLAEHPAKVTIRVMGIAASAASVIAMAGDEVLMGVGTMMMIHNAWGLVIGNRHDFAEAAQVFETFDKSMATIYAARTGRDEKEILKMLDGPERASDGTFMTASEAIEKGFADGTFEMREDRSQARATLPGAVLAKRKLEAALAAQGYPRKERYALLEELAQGMRDATPAVTRDAGGFAQSLTGLLSSIRNH